MDIIKTIIKSRKLTIICIAIIAVVVISGIVLGVTLSNKKTEEVNTNITDNDELIQEEQTEILNEAEEYIDINELENTQTNVIQNNNNSENKTGTTPYYIKVNNKAQVVTIYKKDKDGYYKVPVKAMICSTGDYTPKSGVYKIPARWKWLGLQGDVYGQYCTQITGNILFHSVPYLEKFNPASLEYWEYDKLGTYASAGCIRLTVADAIWIYNNCARGTMVEFYSDSNAGPLGKPTARKISNAQGNLKNWDPTDPDPKNPWRNYKEDNSNSNDKTNRIQNNIVNDVNKNNTTGSNTNTVGKNEIVNQITNTIKNEIMNTIKNEITNDKNNNINLNNQVDSKVNQITNSNSTN